MKKTILGTMIAVATFASLAADISLPNTATISDIQAAIDAAEAGDVITLADGTYTFNAPLTIEKGITLTGSHRDNCILQGSASTPLETALTIKHVDACVKNVTIADISTATSFNNFAVGVRIFAGLLTQSRVTRCKCTTMNRTAGVSLEGTSEDVARMTYCMIDHNEATSPHGTGGVRFLDKCGVMANCLVWANKGTGDYGAGGIGIVNVTAWSKFKIVNCTVVGNSSENKGGGIHISSANVGDDDGSIVNTIVAGNTAPSGADFQFGNDQVKNHTGYNCLCPSIVYGVNAINGEPLFVDAENGDFRLQPSSRARNTGDKEKAAAVLGLDSIADLQDFYGNDRVLEDIVDVGCAEFVVDPNQPTCVIGLGKDQIVSGDDVTLTAVADGFGSAEDLVYSWELTRPGSIVPERMESSNASLVLTSLEFGSYTAAVRVSSVSVGKSAESVPMTFIVLPKTMYVTSRENPGAAAPYGTQSTAATSLADALAVAVEGTTVMLDEGTHDVSETVVLSKGLKIVGAGRDKTTVYATAEFDPVVRINGQGAILQGVTVAHGRVKTWWQQSGSGVVIGSDGGTLADCRVTDCGGSVSRIFGAVNISGSDALVTRCLIDGNFSLASGSVCGGIYAKAGRIESCVIANNECWASQYIGDHKGSGLCLAGPVTVLNCTIVGNRMFEGHVGGGVHVESDSARVHNCIINGNLSGDGTESDYVGHAASFSCCLSSQTAPAGSTGCLVGTPVFDTRKPYCLVKDSPGRSQGSVIGYETRLMSATDFYGRPRVKNVDRKGVADIDIGATESRYLTGMILLIR